MLVTFRWCGFAFQLTEIEAFLAIVIVVLFVKGWFLCYVMAEDGERKG